MTSSPFWRDRTAIFLGNLMLAVFSGIIYWITRNLPQIARFPFRIIMYMLYIIGDTCQCCVTKPAQTCLTNDPKQRLVFSMFSMAFGAVMSMSLTTGT